jgi:septum formation protein
MSRTFGPPTTRPLVLASTSHYRQMLLERLAVPFTTASPNVDEAAAAGELPDDLVSRLARTKANVVAQRHPTALVIGSDQLAICDRRLLGKPGSAENCAAQLRSVSGRRVEFKTAVHVVDAQSASNEAHIDVTTVHFRSLSEKEIQRYVEKEQPFDCAGGFKVEGLGISLFESIESRDPTALIGLPLIWLSGALRRFGIPLP